MPSTASSHLSQLTDASLLEIAKQGRHRYFRIASPEVARMLEMLLGLASGARAPSPARVPLRRARVCYDHLAGEAGVALYERMVRRKYISDEKLTRAGEKWLASIGIDVATLRKKRRPLCRACLDWTERRTHLAGSVGAALLDRMLALRFAKRDQFTRAVIFSKRGEAFLTTLSS